MPPFVPVKDGVPTYFIPMLADKQRNQTYEAAIKETIDQFVQTQGRAPTVLDLGAGSGLLSIMCLHHGAEHVTLLDAHETLCNIAECQLEDLGISRDRWSVVTKLSTKLKSPARGGTVYDILVCELIGSMINSESMYSYMSDLLKRGIIRHFAGKFYTIPQRGEMTLGVYQTTEASIDTGIEYAPMHVIYDAVHGKEVDARIDWFQDEEVHICLARSKCTSLAENVSVLTEQYNVPHASEAVRFPFQVEIGVVSTTNFQDVLLVLEWQLQLSDSIVLDHTLKSVEAMTDPVMIARWINWGFLHTKLCHCTEPHANGQYKLSVKRLEAGLEMKMI
jgi:predicted RNA methylase